MRHAQWEGCEGVRSEGSMCGTELSDASAARLLGGLDLDPWQCVKHHKTAGLQLDSEGAQWGVGLCKPASCGCAGQKCLVRCGCLAVFRPGPGQK